MPPAAARLVMTPALDSMIVLSTSSYESPSGDVGRSPADLLRSCSTASHESGEAVDGTNNAGAGRSPSSRAIGTAGTTASVCPASDVDASSGRAGETIRRGPRRRPEAHDAA